MMKFAQLSFALALTDSTKKMTKTDSGEVCIFPFIYKGVEHNECTNVNWLGNASGTRSWCATKIDKESKYMEEYGSCSPNPDMECEDYKFGKDCLKARDTDRNKNCTWDTLKGKRECVDCFYRSYLNICKDQHYGLVSLEKVHGK